jgi:hypothetical protein
MKKNLYVLLIALTAMAQWTTAQEINWAAPAFQRKHLVTASVGIEHGMIYGLGYGHRISNRLFPAVVTINYSFPSGNRIFDDFKTRIGGQVRWLQMGQWQISTRIEGVFRRYQNEFVRMLNFGSDMALHAGYYRTKWFVAGEAGFDKAIVTHFKHSDAYKSQFEGAADGWYEPASGGNFYYGLQAGYSFHRSDVFMKAGKSITQDFRTEPLIPVYLQLGYTVHF